MDIVLGIVGSVIVNHHRDVVNVQTARHDVRGDHEVNLCGAEEVDDFVAFLLFEVGVHGSDVVALAFQDNREFLDLLLGGAEKNDTAGRMFLEHFLQNERFVSLRADIDALADVVGRLGNGNFYFDGVAHDGASQFRDARRHGGGEEHGLSFLRHLLDDGHDVLGEAHVQHAVCFVQHEVGGAAEVKVAELEVGDETPGRGEHNVRTCREGATLLFVADAIVAAIDGDGAYAGVVGEALQRLVDLSGEFSGRSDDETVHGVFGMRFASQKGEEREEICRRLARTGLCDAEDVASFKDGGNATGLNRRALFKAHVVECVKHVVGKVQVFKKDGVAVFFFCGR